MMLPGILLNDTVWVHGNDARELQAAWGKAWFDHVLHAHDDKEEEEKQPEDAQEEDDDEEDDDDDDDEEESLQYVPAPLRSPLSSQQLLNTSLRSNTSTPSSLYTSPSTTSSQLVNIPLPNGTHVEMGSLIRLLMRGTSVCVLLFPVLVLVVVVACIVSGHSAFPWAPLFFLLRVSCRVIRLSRGASILESCMVHALSLTHIIRLLLFPATATTTTQQPRITVRPNGTVNVSFTFEALKDWNCGPFSFLKTITPT